MSKPKLNDPDVEQTTTIGIFSNNINQSMNIIVDKNGFAIPQTKSPTLEEVKKEWEELEYKWFEDDYKIRLITTVNDFVTEIYLDKVDRKYCCFDGGTGEEYNTITIQEHQLLTKTFKVLGWL